MIAQPDLFAPPAVAPLVIEPNQHGVYPENAAESLTLPNPRKGWLGCPLAEIHLLHVAGIGWLYSTGMWLAEGGYGGPIMADRRGAHAARHDAIEAAVAEVRTRAEKEVKDRNETHTRQARAVIAWLETLA